MIELAFALAIVPMVIAFTCARRDRDYDGWGF